MALSIYSSEDYGNAHIHRMKQRKLFSEKWLIKNPDGTSYFNIQGVKITGKIMQSANDIRVFELIFPRSLFINTFFNDVYEKSLVNILDRYMPYGVSGYTDGNFDVTIHVGDVVIDAGAWFGDFSAYAASKEGVLVYAFEPTETTYALLCDTARLNDGKIIPIKMALGDYEGSIEMGVFENCSATNSIVPEFYGSRETQTINCTTLDAFVDKNNIERIDFVKIDIEGAERYMLSGMKNVLKKFAPRLVVCTYHLPDDPVVLEKLILEANPNYTIVHQSSKLFAAIVE